MRIRLASDILSSEPGVRRDAVTDEVLMETTEGLVGYAEDLTLAPRLATSWEVTDEGRQYVFHLRQGVRFQDGTPLNAAAVVWSLRYLLAPTTHWRCAHELNGEGLTGILDLQAPDASTVVIRLDRRTPLFLATLARPDCGGTPILARSSLDARGRWRAPVGTGPFAFARWQRGRSVELEANRDYWAAASGQCSIGICAHAAGLEFLVVPDASTALAGLETGELDGMGGILPYQLRMLRRRLQLRIAVHPTLDAYAILLQTRVGSPFADARLRRALAASLDVRAIAAALSEGSAIANRSLVAAPSPAWVGRQRDPPPADVQRARELLHASGYRGEPLTLLASRDDTTLFDAALLVQAMAHRIGLELRIETVDWSTELARYLSGNYTALSFAYSARLDPVLAYDAVIGDKGREPRKVWDTPIARELLGRAREADPATRAQSLERLYDALLEETPLIVLFNPARIVVTRPEVDGFRGWSAGADRWWTVHKP